MIVRNLKNTAATAVLSGILLVSACESIPVPGSTASPVEKLAQQDIMKATLIGAAAGAAVGGVIGNNTELGTEKGAAIGAVVGGIGGAIVGNVAANRRKQFASESAFIENEVASTEQAISSKEAQLQQAKVDLEATNTEVADLVRRHNNNEAVLTEATEKRNQLTQRIASYNGSLKSYSDAISYLENVIATSTPAEGEDPEALQAKIDTLTAKKTTLVAQYNELNGIKDQTQIALNQLNALSQG